MAAYGAKQPRYGIPNALAGGPASASPMPKPPPSAVAGGPASFFGTDPFGLSRASSQPQIVAPPVSAPAPKAYAAPAGPSPQQQPGLPQNLAQPPAIQTVNPTYDLNTDPILQQASALTHQSRQDAMSGALSLRKQLAIDYGDADYARNVLGDEGTAQAAAANPNSVRAQLAKSRDQQLAALEDALNKSNLFYSGERVKQQGLAADNYQSALAGATSKEQAALNTIAQNLAAALYGADMNDLYAAQQAGSNAYGGVGGGSPAPAGPPLGAYTGQTYTVPNPGFTRQDVAAYRYYNPFNPNR